MDSDRRPRSVLVISLSGIGDLLLMTPLVRSMRVAWPDAAIDVLARRGRDGILAGNPDIREVITVSRHPGLLGGLRLLGRIARRYDLAVSTRTDDRQLMYARLAGRRAVSLVRDRRRGAWKRRLLTASVTNRSDRHTLANILALAPVIGVEPRVDQVPSVEAVGAAELRQRLGVDGRYAILHPFPRNIYKQWTADGWVAVARHLQECGVRPVFEGGPAGDERRYVAALASRVPDAIDATGHSFREVTDLLRHAALFVGVDTATSHLAAAVGTPTVVLFGPTDPTAYGPWPPGLTLVDSPYRSSGSQEVGCVSLVHAACTCGPPYPEGCDNDPRKPSRCLASLDPAAVIAAVDRRL